MPPSKQRHQQSHSGNLHQPSDYESDVAFLSDAPPALMQRTDEELNLSVLRRHNRDVYSLEYVAPYAVVYQFSPDSQQWEKCGIEGTAFVCGLLPTEESPQRYEVTVLNRRGLNNFALELLNATDVEVTEEYIILNSINDAVPHVYGLWVFSEPPPSSTSHHRTAIAQKIQGCAQRVENARILASEAQDNGYNQDLDDSAPMTRQMSLKELFGQQRQEDDAWSIRSHSPRRPSAQFTTSADTDFFRAAHRHVQPHSPAVSAQSNGQGRDVLLDLFRKAGEGYHAGM
ncbi:hypothetical protein MMC19_005552 [Ptychographa xylographoides]|nr:hypothetical protein [Ptychographa xylographoides]